mmetsp:Transcript_26581/g.42599  ORF Transcript_26581/g.42599 Transcript_26581/m.42599 type:complete len:282 (+) Transcript_26581:240-1085(+)
MLRTGLARVRDGAWKTAQLRSLQQTGAQCRPLPTPFPFGQWTRTLSANVWVRADLGSGGKLAVPVRAGSTVSDLIEEIAINSQCQALLVEGSTPETRVEDALRRGFVINVGGRDVWLEESENCAEAQQLALGPASIPAWVLPRAAFQERVGGMEAVNRLEANGLIYTSKVSPDRVVLHPDFIRARFTGPLPRADPFHELERRPARPWRDVAVRWAMLAGVTTVQGVLFYMTFFYLSWDIVEPITYFVGSTTNLLALLWYIKTSSSLSYGSVLRRTCWQQGR